MNYQQHCLDQIAVDINKVKGRTLHIFVYDSLLDVAVFTFEAVAGVVTKRLVPLLLTSLELFLGPCPSFVSAVVSF